MKKRKPKTISWTSRNGVGLLNALYNCHKDNTTDHYKRNYARGVLVGLVSGLMYDGFYFDEAWEQIVRRVEIDPNVIPDKWPTRDDYDAVKGVTE